jgi:hypothetical protein
MASSPPPVRDARRWATGTAEGSGEGRDRKYAVVTYRAEKHKRTWLSLIEWRHLDHRTALRVGRLDDRHRGSQRAHDRDEFVAETAGAPLATREKGQTRVVSMNWI